MHISQLSIRRPVATTMFFLAVVLIGVISFSRLAVDLFPSLQFPRLVIWTTYSNVSPEEVETFITDDIEGQLIQVAGVRDVHSVSREGVSLITLEFDWKADMEYAMLNVREKLDILRTSLPDLAGRPTILRADPNAEPIMSLAVSGRGGLVQVKGLAENVVKRRLEQIDGVALAAVTGGSDRQIRVEVDREIVESLGINLQEIQRALDQANAVSQGGNINRGRFTWFLRPVGDFQTMEDIRKVVVARRGERLVTVEDVGEVIDGFKERDNLTRFNANESIGILVQKESGSNTSQVSSRVREVLAELEEEYPGLTVAVAFDQAEFVNDSISNVIWAIALGGLFAFFMLFFFLHDIRNPVNIGLAIPISIIATFTLLYFSGISLNMMSLGGLALGVGLLVDNSIVVLENIFRHREEGEDRFEAAAAGAREVGMAVTASTFTTISVFLPIVFVEGVAGQLFRDQALTVAFSLLASLIVSLTLLPMLASRFLHMESYVKEKLEAERIKKEAKTAKRTEGTASQAFIEPVQPPGIFRRLLRGLSLPFIMLWKVVKWMAILIYRLVSVTVRFVISGFTIGLKGSSNALRSATAPLFRGFDRGFERFSRVYHNILEWSLDNRATVIGICAILVAAAVWIGYGLDRRLIPVVDQGEFSIELVMPTGTNLRATADAAGVLEGWLLEMPEVEHVFMNAGLVKSESALGSQDTDINTATVRVHLKSRRRRSTFDIVAELRERGREIAGAELTFNTGETTFTEILGTSQADLAVKIRGVRLDTLQRLANLIEDQLTGVSGLRDIHTDFAVGKPEIRLTVDHRVIEQYGLSVNNVVNLVASTIKGEVATDFQDFDRKVEILVREGEGDTQTLQQILAMGIPIGQGANSFRIPLRELVSWRYTTGPNEVRREAQNRQISVYASVEGRKLDDVITEVGGMMVERDLPDGYEVVVGGVNEEMKRSFRSLFFALGLAILLVYMILAAQFESPVHPFTIMATVPLATIGVVFGLKVFGAGINVMSMVGMVVLTGIVVNDGIIKVDFINQLREKGRPLRKAIVEAGHYRLRPILMTTVTTILGLTPMALGIGAGAELRSPLAIAVIGGEISATGLTLIVIPVVYSLLESIRGEKLGDKSTSFNRSGAVPHGEVRL